MTPPAGANVCRVSVTLPYTTTSASVARSETVVWTHDASAGDDASVAQNSTAAIKTNARTRSLTGFRRTRGGSGSLGRLSAEERAQPVAECLQDRDGDQSVLPDHVVELAPREHQTFHRPERGDRRGAGPTVEKRDLSEEIARPKLAQVAALAPHLRGPGEDDEELAAARPLAAEIPSRDEVHFVDLRRDEGKLLVIARREQRYRLQHRDPWISHRRRGYVVGRPVARRPGASGGTRRWGAYNAAGRACFVGLPAITRREKSLLSSEGFVRPGRRHHVVLQ